MLEFGLKICERWPQDMQGELADALFGLASLYGHCNFPQHALHYAQRHFKERSEVEHRHPTIRLSAGLGHSELAHAYIRNDQFEEAIEHAVTARFLHEQSQEFQNDDYWPTFAICHHACGLLGLKRATEAEEMLSETILWRVRKYGPADLESYKCVADFYPASSSFN